MNATTAPTLAAPAGPRPIAALAELPPFVASPPPQSIELRLDRNERRGVLTPTERAAMAACDPGEYTGTGALEAQIARRLGVSPEQVLVTSGATDALERIARAFLAPGRRMLSPTPTFALIPYLARLTGAAVDTVPWPEGDLDAAAMLAAARPETAVISVVSPNNPTGAVISSATLRALAEGVPQALLVIDQAYAEYADRALTAEALEFSNTVVVRTLSKAWGLANLRVGYVVGPAPIIAVLRAAGSPFPVSGPTLAAAAARLEHGAEALCEHVQTIRRERRVLRAILKALGADAQASQGNFVLARVGDRARVHAVLKAHGIMVRETLAVPDGLRITCPGSASGFGRLRRALLAARHHVTMTARAGDSSRSAA